MNNKLKNKSIICIIPARGGSKGIIGKNKKLFFGKPLVDYSIEYALSSLTPDCIFLSTDDKDIMSIGEKKGIKIIDRPEKLAGDDASTESAVNHVLQTNSINADLILILQPTSPLRPKNSLDKLIIYFFKYKFDSLLTISPTHRFFWKINGKIANPLYDIENRPRRQDMNEKNIRFVENGSVYAFTYNHFIKSGNRLGGKIGYFIFPEEFSYELDSITDWEFLESIAKQKENNFI